MQTQKRKSRRSLNRIAGAVLMMSCASAIAASIASIPDANTAPGRLMPVLAQAADTEGMSGTGPSARASAVGHYADRDSPATAPADHNKAGVDAEIAVLLDWHVSANTTYGSTLPPEDMLQTR